MTQWGYGKHNGPHTWGDSFSAATGKRQSPIDLVTADLETSESSPLEWSYVPENAETIINGGVGWRVQINGEGSALRGGPLEDEYKVEQFHCHWGGACDRGSEHTVNGKKFPAELHIVHWNCSKYSSFSEAADKPDGLAVLGVFLQVGEENPEVKKIASALEKIKFKGQTAEMTSVDPGLLLPDKHDYWTYEGSLTTPPCYESVTWIVFQQPVSVSEEQLEAFRGLKSHGADEPCDPCDEFGGNILDNFRPPLECHGRCIKMRHC